MSSCVLSPNFTESSVEQTKSIMNWICSELPQQERLKDGIMKAAYKSDPLGYSYITGAEDIEKLTLGAVEDFKRSHYTRQNMVVAAVGVEHAEMVDMVASNYASVPRGAENVCGKSVYKAGEYRFVDKNSVDGLNRVAIGFELGSWHDDDLVPICVLQTLLGGGDSFSAGGPGKGMYSRLYREVLNRCFWAEAAECYTILNNDGGIIGISGASKPYKSQDLTVVFLEQFAKLTVQTVTDEELIRAKNMLCCNILTQLESRAVLAEDLARQISTYGKRESGVEVVKKIQAVTKDDIMRIAKRAMCKPPSIAVVGTEIDRAPRFQDIMHLRGAS